VFTLSAQNEADSPGQMDILAERYRVWCLAVLVRLLLFSPESSPTKNSILHHGRAEET
jgi:hypothetical protein